MIAKDFDGQDQESLVAAIVDDYIGRVRRGETPNVDEYVQEFPGLASFVRQVLPAVGLLNSSATNDVQHSTDLSGPVEIPGYRLIREIGRGGMGIVFEAIQESLERKVAIKFLRAITCERPQDKRRFRRESRIVGQLAHPNIVAAIDADFIGERPFLVLEFVDGEDLSKLIDKAGPLPVEQAIDLMIQAARGLASAHRAGVVHRDIKPRNLLLARDGTLKILDLGLACRLAAFDAVDERSLTPGTAVLGTLDYLAPEQARNPRSADARSDLYSLGCTFYELLTGSKLYPTLSAADKLLAHATAAIPRIRDHRQDLPESIEVIFQRMVAKSPGDRFDDASALLAALRSLDRESATESTQRNVSVTIQRGPGETQPGKSSGPAGRRRMPIAIVCSFALASIAGVVLGWAPWQSSTTVAPTKPDRALVVPGRKPSGPPAAAFVDSLGIELVRVPAGRFTMGLTPEQVGSRKRLAVSAADAKSLPREQPSHQVTLSRDFYLGAKEVTVGQFERFVEATGYQTESEASKYGARGWNPDAHRWELSPRFTWRHPGFEQGENNPVVNVSWNDASAFCGWLSAREMAAYRLPTEAEWEYACKFAAGDSRSSLAPPDLQQVGNIADQSLKAIDGEFRVADWNDHYPFTAPVGSFAPNALGLYDTLGNVWEWCQDWHSPHYDSQPAVDPTGPASGERRVARGGSWTSARHDATPTTRAGSGFPEARSFGLGFRVVREASATP